MTRRWQFLTAFVFAAAVVRGQGPAPCATIVLASGVPQVLPCVDVGFTIAPQAGRWNMVGVSSTADWDLDLGSAYSHIVGNACDYLFANGHAGAITETSGRMEEYSGSPVATGQFEAASVMTVGAPHVTSWSSAQVIKLLEFNVTSLGSYDLIVNGDPSLSWRLLPPATGPAWTRQGAAGGAGGGSGSNPSTNLALTPGWWALAFTRSGGPAALPSTSLTVTVIPASTPLAVPVASPQVVSSGLQRFSVSPTQDNWNVVGIASQVFMANWDMTLGPAQSRGGVSSCEYAVANGKNDWISTTSGLLVRASGLGTTRAEFRGAQNLAVGAALATEMPQGSLVLIYQFNVAAGGNHDVRMTGGSSLSWDVFAPGSNSKWRARGQANAWGTAGGLPVTTNLAPGWHALVVSRNYGTAPSAIPFTVGVYPSAPVASIPPASYIVAAASCQAFTISPPPSAWNVVGVSSPSDWNIGMGTVESRSAAAACDFLVANGNLGPISPTSGQLTRHSGTLPGIAQHGVTMTIPMNSAHAATWTTTQIVKIIQFQVQSPTLVDINVTGSTFLRWHLFDPGLSLSWRPRSAAVASGPAGGTPITGRLLAAGWHAIVLSRDGGSGAQGSYTVYVTPTPNPVPVLTSISPAVATAGGAAFMLTLSGSSFVNGSVARWNGAALPTTFISATQLTAQVAANLIPTAGTRPVTVLNPSPAGGSSVARTFTIQNPAPALTSLSPSSAVAGGPSLTLLANGNAFNAQSRVRWNGSDLTTALVSATQLSASVPASLIASAGSAQVTVFNPAPGGGTSPSIAFNLIAPAILSLAPASIPPMTPASPPIVVTVNGLSFLPGSRIYADGVALATVFVSSLQLQCTLGPAIPQALLPGGIAFSVENATNAVSNTRALIVGSGANAGTLRRHPLAPAPGASYSLLLEGARAGEPVTVTADSANPAPLTAWPDGVANLVVAAGPNAASPGPYQHLVDGMGLYGPPQSTFIAADGTLLLPGFVLPAPAQGVVRTLQAAYADPTAPYGFKLSWARYPDRL